MANNYWSYSENIFKKWVKIDGFYIGEHNTSPTAELTIEKMAKLKTLPCYAIKAYIQGEVEVVTYYGSLTEKNCVPLLEGEGLPSFYAGDARISNIMYLATFSELKEHILHFYVKVNETQYMHVLAGIESEVNKITTQITSHDVDCIKIMVFSSTSDNVLDRTSGECYFYLQYGASSKYAEMTYTEIALSFPFISYNVDRYTMGIQVVANGSVTKSDFQYNFRPLVQYYAFGFSSAGIFQLTNTTLSHNYNRYAGVYRSVFWSSIDVGTILDVSVSSPLIGADASLYDRMIKNKETAEPTLPDVPNEDDPYENDPDSQGNNDPGGHKGGDGKYQDTDEDVPIPGLPQISAVDTGLCTLLNPTKEELKKLSDFLWSNVFSVDSFKKIFADPMDIILGLSIVPLKVASDTLKRIKISGIDTGVEMYKCASQYIEVDCGSIEITNYWDNFIDYDPYTHYTLYLPYVGYKVLHADEVVDKTITVKYHCDILSGACMAYVQCGKKVLYCFEGNISIQIPVTSASYDNMIHGMLQVASGVGQIIAGGASMAAGGAGAGLMVSGAVGTATGATSAIKPTIGRSGNAESSTGLMGIQKPYLIISRPRAVVPSGLNKYSGYPAYKGGKLGDFNNFTVVQDIRIKNLNGATMEEMNEAERLCKEGVIV